MTIDRRRVVTGITASLATPALWTGAARAAAVHDIAGQLLVVGFPGDAANEPSAIALARDLEAGRVSGVVFLRHNVRSTGTTRSLTKLFASAADGQTGLMCVDQEGGRVQRLRKLGGFTTIPSAYDVAQELGVREAGELYGKLAVDLKTLGFTVNLAPVVDVYNQKNPVIGRFGRAYSRDPRVVAAYAAAFIDAHKDEGIACAVKHFPGHGSSRGDSHNGFVDISRTWNESELEPFRRLIAGQRADIVMGAHLSHLQLAPEGTPVTFSKTALTGRLRGELGFRGLIMTDDLDMGAIRKRYALSDAVVAAVSAGNDLILLSNSLKYDKDLPSKAVDWIVGAVEDGQLDARMVAASAERVAELRGWIG